MNMGLEGVVAAETRLSRVDGAAGQLIVAGHGIEELAADWRLAEVAALLWRDFLDFASDGEAVAQQLARGRSLAFALVPRLLQVTQGASPVEALRTGWSLLRDVDPERHAISAPALLCAAAPVFVAAPWRRDQGLAPLGPDAKRNHAADFLAMLGLPAGEGPARAFERYLVTVADHGMNASTFTARVVASTRAGAISSIVAALCALKGPLHGGAPGPVLDMLDEIGGAAGIGAWIGHRLDSGERLMGFGHRVYRTRDPRADVLKQVVAGLRLPGSRIAFAEEVEAAALAELRQRHPDRALDTNVEFYTALLLDAVGLPRALFTPAFAIGRVFGWSAHVMEQETSGRLIRPAARYIGALPAGAEELRLAG